MAIKFVLKQVTKKGLWTSPEVFQAQTGMEVRQVVTAGWLNGEARWAENVSGGFLFGLDEKGRELIGAPTVPTVKK